MRVLLLTFLVLIPVLLQSCGGLHNRPETASTTNGISKDTERRPWLDDYDGERHILAALKAVAKTYGIPAAKVGYKDFDLTAQLNQTVQSSNLSFAAKAARLVKLRQSFQTDIVSALIQRGLQKPLAESVARIMLLQTNFEEIFKRIAKQGEVAFKKGSARWSDSQCYDQRGNEVYRSGRAGKRTFFCLLDINHATAVNAQIYRELVEYVLVMGNEMQRQYVVWHGMRLFPNDEFYKLAYANEVRFSRDTKVTYDGNFQGTWVPWLQVYRLTHKGDTYEKRREEEGTIRFRRANDQQANDSPILESYPTVNQRDAWDPIVTEMSKDIVSKDAMVFDKIPGHPVLFLDNVYDRSLAARDIQFVSYWATCKRLFDLTFGKGNRNDLTFPRGTQRRTKNQSISKFERMEAIWFDNTDRGRKRELDDMVRWVAKYYRNEKPRPTTVQHVVFKWDLKVFKKVKLADKVETIETYQLTLKLNSRPRGLDGLSNGDDQELLEKTYRLDFVNGQPVHKVKGEEKSVGHG